VNPLYKKVSILISSRQTEIKEYYISIFIFLDYSLFLGWGETGGNWTANGKRFGKSSSWWNENWQGKPKYSKQTCLNVTLFTINSTWNELGINPDRRCRFIYIREGRTKIHCVTKIQFQTLKPQWSLCVPHTLNLSHTECNCNYGFRMLLARKRTYFPIQN
jgi:hypothetical protein